MPDDSTHTPTWLDLERILPLKGASNGAGLSQHSLKRHHADEIIRLGPRHWECAPSTPSCSARETAPIRRSVENHGNDQNRAVTTGS
jgi:hypothetical protein